MGGRQSAFFSWRYWVGNLISFGTDNTDELFVSGMGWEGFFCLFRNSVRGRHDQRCIIGEDVDFYFTSFH
jgi:hypothetical protein